ncbi:MAG: hypothetical protein RSE00_01320 [Clostridia bacterium]
MPFLGFISAITIFAAIICIYIVPIINFIRNLKDTYTKDIKIFKAFFIIFAYAFAIYLLFNLNQLIELKYISKINIILYLPLILAYIASIISSSVMLVRSELIE